MAIRRHSTWCDPGLADGPTEVHKVTVARQVLRDYKPVDDLWPSQHLPKKLATARAKFAPYISLTTSC
jgi:acyl-CoA dehydrogenase